MNSPAARHGFFLAALLLVLAGGLLAGALRGQRADADMRQGLLMQASYLAQTVSVDHVRALAFTAEDRDKPVFHRFRDHLQAYAGAVQDSHGPAIRYLGIYTMARRGDLTLFGPESIPESHPFASPPGTIYENPPAAVDEAFRLRHPRTTGPYSDEYGTFVSAFAPLTDPRTGEVLMVLGLDIDARHWRTLVLQAWVAPLIVTALLLLMMLAARRALLQRRSEAAVTAAAGVLLSVAVALGAHEGEQRSRQTLFSQVAENHALDVVRALREQVEERLTSLVSFFESSEEVTRREFHRFVHPLTSRGSSAGFGWIPRVTGPERAAFESRARSEGVENFRFYALDAQGRRVELGEQSLYYPVFFAAPAPGDPAPLGLDLGSEPRRRAALEQMAKTGLTTATDPIVLAHSPRPGPGLLVLQAVRNGRVAESSESSVQGFAVAVLHLPSLLREAMGPPGPEGPSVFLDLHHLTPDSVPRLLTATGPEGLAWEDLTGRMGVGEPSVIHPLFAFGQSFAIVLRPGPAFQAASAVRAGWIAGAIGLLMTLVLTAFIAAIAHRRADLERQVQIRTLELQESEARYRSMISALSEGVVVQRADGVLTAFNGSAQRILGLEADAEGKPLGSGWEMLREDGSDFPKEELPFAVTLRTGVGQREVVVGLRRSGAPLSWLSINSEPLYRSGDPWPYAVVSSFQDVTDRKAEERRLQYLATTDPLTGLPNRRTFLERLAQELARTGRSGDTAALLLLDLDHFKQVNDTHGHALGDAVLERFAAILGESVRKADVAGRLGGEEFAVLLPETDLEGGRMQAERIRQTLARESFTCPAGELKVTVSIGVTVLVAGKDSPDSCMARADAALYQAKHQGRNRVAIKLAQAEEQAS